MSRWFRHYAGMMRDDKLVRVALKSGQTIERVCWVWGAILEAAAEIDGNGRYDVDAAEIAYFLRADEADIVAVLHALEECGRIYENSVVKWSNRQFQSDKSNSRVAEYRERKRAEKNNRNSREASRNGDVTLHTCYSNAPETETETETDNPPLSPLPSKQKKADYHFAQHPIRLTRRDYDDWRKRFHAIPDFDAELSTCADWLKLKPDRQKDWFATGASWLNRRHQAALADQKSEVVFSSPC